MNKTYIGLTLIIASVIIFVVMMTLFQFPHIYIGALKVM
jgi:hypothetical protein